MVGIDCFGLLNSERRCKVTDRLYRCSSKICHTLLIFTFPGCFIDHVDDKTSSVSVKVGKKLGVVERFISLEGIFTDLFLLCFCDMAMSRTGIIS